MYNASIARSSLRNGSSSESLKFGLGDNRKFGIDAVKGTSSTHNDDLQMGEERCLMKKGKEGKSP